MPTTVATMSRVKGLVERVPFHHADVRTEKKKRTIAPVKPAKAVARTKKAKAVGAQHAAPHKNKKTKG
jgi:hypothetical protein